jgi:flagellar basal-body rod protein FlgF
MDPATYIAAAGMKSSLRALDIAANNMANVNSPGFKADSPFYRELQQAYGTLSGSAIAGEYTDFRPGSMRMTENPLDLAINGEGFFTIRTPAGDAYTRNGSFTISPAGELVTQDGYQVLDANGQPIAIALDPQRPNEVMINHSGDITIDEQPVATLGIVAFDDPAQMVKLEAMSFRTNQPARQVVNPMVEQGAIEQSNADAVATMLEMIDLQRMFEMNSKTVLTIMNQVNRQAIDGIAAQ